jgi:hypothetical protein
MTGRRLMLGALAVAIAGAGVAWKARTKVSKPAAETARAGVASPRSPLLTLADGLKVGDAQALAATFQRTAVEQGATPVAFTEAEAKDWVVVLDGLRAGYIKFAPVGRVSAILATTRILERFRLDPTPSAWIDALQPSHALLTAGVADNHVEVRATALTEIGRLWNWLPGRTMTPLEEVTLADWKDAFREPATRRLGDRDPKGRASAVVCLGSSPIDSMAALVAPYIDDPENGGVRFHTLKVLAARPSVLGDEAILRRLHDSEPGVPELAEIVLKTRGLTKEQIFLGRQLYHPKPEVRVSIVPLIRERTDIDPLVWLLQLSRDSDETVRTKAAEALVGRPSQESVERLREMAATDASPEVRAAANKLVSVTVAETTASLPPLPGSASLNLKAN